MKIEEFLILNFIFTFAGAEIREFRRESSKSHFRSEEEIKEEDEDP